MKFKKMVEKEFTAKTLLCRIGVRYWEDGTVNGETDSDGTLVPCRNGDLWCPEIDFDTGKITNWKQGVKADLHYKVCDAGRYILNDGEGNVVAEIDGYVPNCMCPVGGGYGDYIIMNIAEDGQIQKWIPTLDGFLED